MAPGSGPEPVEEHRPLPEGWTFSDDGLAMVGGDLPPKLGQRLDRIEPQILAKLEADQALAAAISELIWRHQPNDGDIDHPDASVEGSDVYNRLAACALGAIAAAHDLAQHVGPPDVSVSNTWRFILDRIFEGDPYVASVAGRLHPVRLLANISQETAAVGYRPGEIVMIFDAASRDDREAYGGLIHTMQRYLGHPNKAGGRPPVDREQRATAAKLSHWCGFTNSMIAEFFGWPDDRAGQRRAADYVAQGAEILGIELDSMGRPTVVPPALADRAKLLRQTLDRSGNRSR